MTATPRTDAQSAEADGQPRLRVEVYDALAAQKGLRTVVAQAEYHGTGRQHMFDIRSGRGRASLGLAMRMALDLGTTVEALFDPPRRTS